ncbi:MAG TPA: alcohol dehydrogenase catalytic domain-containing protein, partial [Kofleriaceae bacterium]
MKSSYLAAQVLSPGKLTLTELPIREPGPTEVRIRVEACGICRTDASTVTNALGNVTYPRVPGHEVVGRIDAIGASVEGWKPGDRVGIGFLAGACGHCASCRRNDPLNCTQQPYAGIHIDGGYAEMMIVRASALADPAELEATQAAPLLCAGITMYSALRKASVGARPGALVAIQGVGGLGHLGIQYAR